MVQTLKPPALSCFSGVEENILRKKISRLRNEILPLRGTAGMQQVGAEGSREAGPQSEADIALEDAVAGELMIFRQNAFEHV